MSVPTRVEGFGLLHWRNATKVSFCCVSVRLGTYFSGVMPVDSNALGDVMLHFSGEAAVTQTSKSLWLTVSRRWQLADTPAPKATFRECRFSEPILPRLPTEPKNGSQTLLLDVLKISTALTSFD